MNSNTHESAAWRSFGMLDTDEAAGFDEAMQNDPSLRNAYQEMEAIAAAVAVIAAPSVMPKVGQLERLERRLGIPTRKRTNWPAISGWAAAAAIALAAVISRNPDVRNSRITQSSEISPKQQFPSVAGIAENSPAFSSEEKSSRDASRISPEVGNSHELAGDRDQVSAPSETRRLIQEIEVLREKLQTFEQNNRERFEPVPGMTWPIVMKMSPPGVPAEEPASISLHLEEPPMTAILGDALAGATIRGAGIVDESGVSKSSNAILNPSAVPIYDAARDTGTLVVNNLPQSVEGESYNLWVKTQDNDKPIHVGRLPKSNSRAADSFDFSLGASGIVPTGFYLTRDSQGDAMAPSGANTVLQGP